MSLHLPPRPAPTPTPTSIKTQPGAGAGMGGEEAEPPGGGGAAPGPGGPAAAAAPAGAGGWGLMGGLGDLLGEEVQKLREEVELSVEEALGIEPGRPAAAAAIAAGPPPPGAEAGGGPAGRSRAASGDSAGAAEAAEGQLARLQRRNEELMHQLAAVDAGETAAVVEEASRRVHDSERKIIRLQRERDKCVAFAAANAPPAPRRPDPFARR